MNADKIAEIMLGIKPDTLRQLYPTIYDKLISMEKLVNIAGGSIRSRQIVALVIMQWKFDEE